VIRLSLLFAGDDATGSPRGTPSLPFEMALCELDCGRISIHYSAGVSSAKEREVEADPRRCQIVQSVVVGIGIVECDRCRLWQRGVGRDGWWEIGAPGLVKGEPTAMSSSDTVMPHVSSWENLCQDQSREVQLTAPSLRPPRRSPCIA